MDNREKIDHAHDFSAQFRWNRMHWFAHMDIINWIRFFFIIKAVPIPATKTILEIGEGSGIVRKVLAEFVERYDTFDVNRDLQPTYCGDVRTRTKEVERDYDYVIAADILEHIPFGDLPAALANICSYLGPAGKALITIPHRASYFMAMDPRNIPFFLRIPTGLLSFGAFYRRFIRRKIWIDPNHQWEIGDGHHTIKDVERVMRDAGFAIEKRRTLFYVDFWILKKI